MPSYSAVSLTSTRTTPLSDFRNKIINGNMDIWQRASGVSLGEYEDVASDISDYLNHANFNLNLLEGFTTDDAAFDWPDPTDDTNFLDMMGSDVIPGDYYGVGTRTNPGPMVTMGCSGDLSYFYGPDRFAFQSSNNLRYAMFRTTDTPASDEAGLQLNTALRVIPTCPLYDTAVELSGDTDVDDSPVWDLGRAYILGGYPPGPDYTLGISEQDLANYPEGLRRRPIQKFAQIVQVIEGYNISTLINQFATMSFWVKSSVAGTYSLSFRNMAAEGMDGFDAEAIGFNSSNGHYYVSEYNIPEANKWYKIEVSMKFNMGDVFDLTEEQLFNDEVCWGKESNAGVIVGWTLVAHDDYQTNKVNRWQRIYADDKYNSENYSGADGDYDARFEYTQFLPKIAGSSQTQFDSRPASWKTITLQPRDINQGGGNPVIVTDAITIHFPQKADGNPDSDTGFFLTGIQFEEGAIPSEIESRNRQQETNLCMRYFTKSMQGVEDTLNDRGPHDAGLPSGSAVPASDPRNLSQGKLLSGIRNEISYVSLPEDMRVIPTVVGFNNFSGSGRSIGIDWALFGNYNSRRQIVAYTQGLPRPSSSIPDGLPDARNIIHGESHWIANSEFYGGTLHEGSLG